MSPQALCHSPTTFHFFSYVTEYGGLRDRPFPLSSIDVPLQIGVSDSPSFHFLFFPFLCGVDLKRISIGPLHSDSDCYNSCFMHTPPPPRLVTVTSDCRALLVLVRDILLFEFAHEMVSGASLFSVSPP